MSIFKITGSASAVVGAISLTGSTLVVKAAQASTPRIGIVNITGGPLITKVAQLSTALIDGLSYAPEARSTRVALSNVLVDELIALLLGRPQSDIVTTADELVRLLQFNRLPADQVTVDDLIDLLLATQRDILDVVVVQDLVQRILGRPVADAVLVADTQARLSITKRLAHAVLLQDAETLVVAQRRTDAAAALDASRLLVSLPRQHQAVTTDVRQLAALMQRLDATAMLDTLAKTLLFTARPEAVLAQDQRRLGPGLNPRDVLTVQDQQQFLRRFARLFQDAVTARENELDITDGFAFEKVLFRFDAAAVTDALTRVFLSFRSFQDSAILVDAQQLAVSKPQVDDAATSDQRTLQLGLGLRSDPLTQDVLRIDLQFTIPMDSALTQDLRALSLVKPLQHQLGVQDALASLLTAGRFPQDLLLAEDVHTLQLGLGLAHGLVMEQELQRVFNASRVFEHSTTATEALALNFALPRADDVSQADTLRIDLGLQQQHTVQHLDLLALAVGKSLVTVTADAQDALQLSLSLQQAHAVVLTDELARTLNFLRVLQDEVSALEINTEITDGFQFQTQLLRLDAAQALDEFNRSLNFNRVFEHALELASLLQHETGLVRAHGAETMDASVRDVGKQLNHAVSATELLQQFVATTLSDSTLTAEQINLLQRVLRNFSDDVTLLDVVTIALLMQEVVEDTVALTSRTRRDVGKRLPDATALLDVLNASSGKALLDIQALSDAERLGINKQLQSGQSVLDTDQFVVAKLLQSGQSVLDTDQFDVAKLLQSGQSVLDADQLAMIKRLSHVQTLTDAILVSGLLSRRVDLSINVDDQDRLLMGLGPRDTATAADALRRLIAVQRNFSDAVGAFDFEADISDGISVQHFHVLRDALQALDALLLTTRTQRLVQDVIGIVDADQLAITKRFGHALTLQDTDQLTAGKRLGHALTLQDADQLAVTKRFSHGQSVLDTDRFDVAKLLQSRPQTSDAEAWSMVKVAKQGQNTLRQLGNLFTYSQDLTSGWAYALTTSVSVQGTGMDQLAPNGTSSALFLMATNTSGLGARYLAQTLSVTPSSGDFYTISFYAKTQLDPTFGFPQTRYVSVGGLGWSTSDSIHWRFDLGGGVVSPPSNLYDSTGDIYPVGNGWYRCWVTLRPGTSDSTTLQTPRLYLTDLGSGDVVQGFDATPYHSFVSGYGVYLWSPQINSWDHITNYVATTATAVVSNTNTADDTDTVLTGNGVAGIRSSGDVLERTVLDVNKNFADFVTALDEFQEQFAGKQGQTPTDSTALLDVKALAVSKSLVTLTSLADAEAWNLNKEAKQGLDTVRTEGTGGNLLRFSNTLTSSTHYSTTNAFITAVSSAATLAPDGTATAYALTENGAAQLHGFTLASYTSVVSQVILTSIFAKARTPGRRLAFYGMGINTAPSEAPRFNLETGQVFVTSSTTKVLAAGMYPVGNGWYRCWALANPATVGNPAWAMVTSDTVGILVDYAGTTGSGVYVWGPQVNFRSVVTNYVATTGSAITTNINRAEDGDLLLVGDGETFPRRSGNTLERIDFSITKNIADAPTATDVFRKLLILNPVLVADALTLLDNDVWRLTKSARQGRLTLRGDGNVLLYSTDLTSSTYWALSNAFIATVSSAATLAPDGTATAYSFTEDGATSTHSLSLGQFTVVTGQYTLFSIFAKSAGTGRRLTFNGGGVGTAPNETPRFNLDTGQVFLASTSSRLLSAGMYSVGNGWYRCWVQVLPITAATCVWSLFNSDTPGTSNSYTGTSGTGIYVWGPQINYWPNISNYVATTGSAITFNTRTANDTDAILVGNAVAGVRRSGDVLERTDFSINKDARQGISTLLQAGNLLTWSQNYTVSATSWTVRNGVSSVSSTATIAPDGTLTANRITLSGAADPYLGQTVSINPRGKTITNSVWAWRDGGAPTSSFTLYLYDSLLQQVYFRSVFLTTTPTRYSLTAGFNDTTGSTTSFVARYDFQEPNAVTGSSVYVWGAQVELTQRASNYVATTTASATTWINTAGSSDVVRAGAYIATPRLSGDELERVDFSINKLLPDTAIPVDTTRLVSQYNRRPQDSSTTIDLIALTRGFTRRVSDSSILVDLVTTRAFLNYRIQALRGLGTTSSIAHLTRTNYLPYSDSFPSWNAENVRVVPAAVNTPPFATTASFSAEDLETTSGTEDLAAMDFVEDLGATGIVAQGSTTTQANQVADVLALDTPLPWYALAQSESTINIDAGDLLSETAATGYHGVYYTVPELLDNAGLEFVLTVYLRASGRTRAEVRVSGGRWAIVDLSTGTVVDSDNLSNVSMTLLSNNWYRLRMQAPVRHGVAPEFQQILEQFYNQPNDAYATQTLGLVDPDHYKVSIRNVVGTDTHYTGTTGLGVLVFGAQLEIDRVAMPQGNNALNYVRTAGRIRTEAGFTADASDTDLVLVGNNWGGVRRSGDVLERLLLQPNKATKQGTLQVWGNLLGNSTDPAAWIFNVQATSITVSSSATTAPDGTATALKIADSTANNWFHYLQDILPTPLTQGPLYNLSFFCKSAGDARYIMVEAVHSAFGFGQGNTWSVNFNPDSGTYVSTSVTTNALGDYNLNIDMNYLYNGWYRCSMLFRHPPGLPDYNLQLGFWIQDNPLELGTVVRTGVTGTGVYFWGPMVNTWQGPTNYLATVGTTTAVTTVTPAATDTMLAQQGGYLLSQSYTGANYFEYDYVGEVRHWNVPAV